MKNVKKALLVVLCVVLLVVSSVFGTLAYLTDKEAVVNTFTVGQIDILLDEKDVDNDTDLSDITEGSNPQRDKHNEYHLIPGVELDKDPTVTVLPGSEECYVYMVVTVEGFDELTAALPKDTYPGYYGTDDVFLLQNLCNWDPNGQWTFTEFKNGTYRFTYNGTADGFDAKGNEAKEVLPALFTKIKLNGADFNRNNIDNLENVEINVTAYAVQTAGMGDAANAWTLAEADLNRK